MWGTARFFRRDEKGFGDSVIIVEVFFHVLCYKYKFLNGGKK
jgi:hypothetical protein